jgi:hypothetical protein
MEERQRGNRFKERTIERKRERKKSGHVEWIARKEKEKVRDRERINERK